MSVVCFVEKDSDGGVSDPSGRAVTFARTLAHQDGEEVLAAVVASRTSAAAGGSDGDGEEVVPGRRPVLVVVPDPTDIGGDTGTQDGHRRTSKTVAPICSRSPLARRDACEIRSELTKVPFVDPRSSTQIWPPLRYRRACTVEL